LEWFEAQVSFSPNARLSVFSVQCQDAYIAKFKVLVALRMTCSMRASAKVYMTPSPDSPISSMVAATMSGVSSRNALDLETGSPQAHAKCNAESSRNCSKMPEL